MLKMRRTAQTQKQKCLCVCVCGCALGDFGRRGATQSQMPKSNKVQNKKYNQESYKQQQPQQRHKVEKFEMLLASCARS